MSKARVYRAAPEALQNLAVSVMGWNINRSRYGRDFHDALEGYKERDGDRELTISHQRGMLEAALERASRTKFYASVFESMGMAWQDFMDKSNFVKLPVVRKADISNRVDDFRPRPSLRADSVISTSGTTGESFAFPASRNVDPDQWAVWWRYRSWHGIERGDRCALFASAPVIPGELKGKPYRINQSCDEYRFSIFHINEMNAPLYVDSLNLVQPVWIHGNPTAIALLASHMLRLGLSIDFPLKGLTVGSENLLGWQKGAIEAAFGKKVVQHYGLAEAVANISECEYATLHTDEDYSYVEYVEADDRGVCSIVGTGFSNSALSLLRYDTGDLAKPASSSLCECGRPGRIVESIDGRLTDYIVLPDGSKVASLAAPFHASSGLAGAQIHQGKDGSLTVRYIPGAGWDVGAVGRLEVLLRERVGDEIGVSFREVAELPRTSRGKMKLVISEFHQ